jgi:alkaline phosphatase D
MQQFDVDRWLSNSIKRRHVLIGAGVMTGLVLASQWPRRVIAQPKFSAYPFSLGVASGEPLPDSVVLWTRLAPDPLNGGGMPQQNVPVQWQIAADENMRHVVSSGTAIATPELAHSVHIDVRGLEPGRWYWYQFKVGNEVSPIGRTRTLPQPRARVNQLKFAFASCQEYQQGFYSAYKFMAEEDLDFVIHLGDYIYEGGVSPLGTVETNFGGPTIVRIVRQHNSPEIITLEDYRNRHALYKTDPDLQAAHAAFPWIVTWDDHEVDNNWADGIPEDDQTPEEFLARRVAAFQAYYEHMPLRKFSFPEAASIKLFRRFTYGDLARHCQLNRKNSKLSTIIPEQLDSLKLGGRN